MATHGTRGRAAAGRARRRGASLAVAVRAGDGREDRDGDALAAALEQGDLVVDEAGAAPPPALEVQRPAGRGDLRDPPPLRVDDGPQQLHRVGAVPRRHQRVDVEEEARLLAGGDQRAAQQGMTRWKPGMPARRAARSTRAAPSRVAIAAAFLLLDHRTIGEQQVPLVAPQRRRAHVRPAQVCDRAAVP